MQTTITEYPAQTVSIYSNDYSNKVKATTLSLVGSDGIGTRTYPGVEIVPGNLHGTLKAVLTDGINSEAAFISEGNAGRDWAMSSGCFIVVRGYSDPNGFGATPEMMVPLHNRYEVEGGFAEGQDRRA